MTKRVKTRQELLLEIEELRIRLTEAEESLSAIRKGEVDAVVVSGPKGEQVYSLKTVDYTYRRLIEEINEGALTLTNDGTVLYSNINFSNMLQIPFEKVIGSSINDFVVPENRDLLDALIKQGGKKGVKGELSFITMSRTEVPVHISIHPLKLEDMSILCAVVTDLTEQKRIEEIVAAERLARSILEEAAETIVVCDGKGKVIRASKTAHELCGQNPLMESFDTVFPLQLVSGQKRLSGKGIDDIKCYSIADALKGKRYKGLEVDFKRKDGQFFSLLLSAGPILNENKEILGCVVTLTEITELKKIEENLEKNRQWLNTTLRSIGDAVIVTDNKGLVTLMNSIAEKLTGWDENEAKDKPVEEVFTIISGKTGKRAENLTTKVIREGVVVGLADDTVLVAKDGKKMDIADSGAPIKDRENNIIGVVLVFRDITERKKADETLRISERELTIRNKINNIFLTVPDDEMYGEVLQFVLKVMKSDHGVFGYIDEDGVLVYPSMTRDIWDQCQISDKDIKFPRETWGGIWGKALTEKRVILSNERFRVPKGHIPIHRALDVPIIHQGEVIGNLLVGNKATDYDEKDKELLVTIANHIAPVLKARLERDTKEKELKQALDELKKAHEELESRVKERTAELSEINEKLKQEIIEREKVEEKLRETNEQLGKIFSTTHFQIAFLEKDFNFIRVNQAFANGAGYAPEFLVGKNHFDLFPHKENESIFRRVVQTGKPYTAIAKPFEYPNQPERGITYWDWTLHPVKDTFGKTEELVLALIEVTEQKRTKDALIMEQLKLESLLKNESLIVNIASRLNSTDFFPEVKDEILEMIAEEMKINKVRLYSFDPIYEKVLWLDSEDAKTVHRKSEKIQCFPFSKASWLIKMIKQGDNFISSNLSELDKKHRDLFSKNNIIALVVFPIKIADNVIGLISFSQDHEFIWNPETVELFKTIADIIANAWERHYRFQAYLEAEKKRIEAVQMAERSSRLASLGTLAAGIAHEINQPLNALKVKVDGMLYLGERSKEMLTKNLEKNLQNISEQAGRIDEIIQQMRILAKQERGKKPVPLNINEEVKKAFSMIEQRLASHNIKLILELADLLPVVKGQPTQIEQVIINLILNAMDVLDKQYKEDKKIVITTKLADNNLIVEVIDNGPGIPKNYINHIFDPFFTTKVDEEGMGLGLSIVQNIISGVGGTIKAENNKDVGARFIISIPVSEGRTEEIK